LFSNGAKAFLILIQNQLKLLLTGFW